MARRPKIYGSYFFKEQDPAVGMVLDAFDSSGKSVKEVTGGPKQISASTYAGWRSRRVKRPQHCTLAALASECGKEFTLRDKRR